MMERAAGIEPSLCSLEGRGNHQITAPALSGPSARSCTAYALGFNEPLYW